jgi:hypothetical protein
MPYPLKESADGTLKIIPPGNSVASEYKSTVKVSSDQTGNQDDFRFTVKEQSFAAVFGVLLLVKRKGFLHPRIPTDLHLALSKDSASGRTAGRSGIQAASLSLPRFR